MGFEAPIRCHHNFVAMEIQVSAGFHCTPDSRKGRTTVR